MKKVCPKGGCIFPFTQNDNFGQLWTTLDKRRLIQGFRPPPPRFKRGAVASQSMNNLIPYFKRHGLTAPFNIKCLHVTI